MVASDSEEPDINYPEWTDYRKKNGLDPLGMQNSSVNLYQTFLPGISNVTLRMRYYGLYAWLCRTYAQEVSHTDPERWQRFVRRAEALYALIACRIGNERGVAGIEWAQKALDHANSDRIDFATAAEPGSETYYLRQAWGAYGAAYGSQLHAIGIFWEKPGIEIPVPSEAIGERLAQVFADALGDLAALLYQIIDRGTVTLAELDCLAELAPSQISLVSAERALYQEILLTPDKPDDAAALSRRLSVLLILKVTGLLERDPGADEVRWILYAGHDQHGRPLELESAALEAQRQRWWVYHANDLCHVALETLLKFALDTLGQYPAGLTLARLIPLCVDRLLDEVDEKPGRWSGFLATLQPAANPYVASDFQSEWSLSQQIMKGAGRSDESDCAPEIAWKAVMLLGILHRRVRDEDHEIAAELGRFSSEAFQTLLSITRFLDHHMDEPFRKPLARLLEERVVRRHLWVAARKLQHGDYTFLIEADEGRIRLRKKDGPVFTNPRLGPAITFLKDIHLVGGQGLTDYGAEAVRGA